MVGYVYAGVTRYRGGTLSGIYRLPLSGGEWEAKNNGFPEDIHVQTVVIDPMDNDTVWAGTSDGVYVSRDCAESWTRMGIPEKNRQVWSVHAHPSDPNIILAGASPVEIFRSEDAGKTFTSIPSSKVPDTIDTGKFVNRVMRIAVNPAKTSNVFAASEVNGFLRSLDGGVTWEERNDVLLKMVDANPGYDSAILTDNKYEGILDVHALTVSPAMPDAVFIACRMGLFRSTDRGDSWTDMEIGKVAPWVYGRDIKVAPTDPNTLYACVSVASHGDTGGVFRSRDLGDTWERVDHGLVANKTVMACALSTTDPNIVFSTTRAGQCFGSLDGCKTWDTYQMPEGCEGVYALACA